MKTKQQKKEEAEKRAQAHQMRSIQEQLDLIAKRPGESKREKQQLLDELLKLQKGYHERDVLP